MVTVFVYGPWGRLPMAVEDVNEIYKNVKEHLKIEHCALFSNKERTEEIKEGDSIKNGMRLYVVTDPVKKKEAVANLCNHPVDKKCMNCIQADLTDAADEVKKEKYISYKMYKEMCEDKNTQLPDFNYNKIACSNHPVNVTCFKCMEKAITLVPQIYRHVDYVEFEGSFYVEKVVNDWKGSQKQQLGLLLGKYVNVDGKQRALINTIFIPEQKSYPDGFHLEKLEEIPFEGLSIVGAIYTDLYLKEGKQISYKIEKDFFLSAMELDFFYKITQQLKNIQREKFVFVCVTSDKQTNTELNVFLPTNQFYGVMDADLLGLHKDPSTFINTSKRELLYMYRNEYALDVSTKADPYVPVEYFFVTCETGYSKEKKNNILFKNTQLDHILISLEKLAGYFEGEYHNFYKYQNFYVLLSLKKFCNKAQEIFEAVINEDTERFEKILNNHEFLLFLTQLEKHRQEKWNCVACTFLNEAFVTQCEMCGTPKG